MSPAWALLRLASPQLPIGGYSYSQGLEMAVEQGRVRDPASAASPASKPRYCSLTARLPPKQTGPPCNGFVTNTAPAGKPANCIRKAGKWAIPCNSC